ncbi:unnamed protein product [Rhizoctonia solani]|uniref:Ricin B lectin domain-containing protein n=1 Tax=Rhizoctonia solani TaxID=456999 RepID=A0A8H3GFH7_9AGAM|nr:unnamed protein product [Rhizoctonia solani]
MRYISISSSYPSTDHYIPQTPPQPPVSVMSISPGVYRIKNIKTNTVFDLQGGSSNKIHAWTQHHGINQQWFVQLSGDGVVFKNVQYGQFAYTTNIQNGGKLFPSINLTTWNLSRHGNEWTVSLPGTNLVVEIGGGKEGDGGSIHLWENLGLRHQRWLLEKISDGQPQQLKRPNSPTPQEYPPLQQGFQQNFQELVFPSQVISPGTYFLRNVMSSTMVNLHGGSTDEGAEISGYEFNGGNHQKWQIQHTGHGRAVTLRNVQTNTYLWFRGQSFVPSFPVKSSYQLQEYIISAANSGFYISPAQRPGHALSLLYGSAQNRTEIGIWHNDQQDNQKWQFEHA